MDINALLSQRQKSLVDTTTRVNNLTEQQQELERQKQRLLQEALRLDGELRLLRSMKDEKEVEKGKSNG